MPESRPLSPVGLSLLDRRNFLRTTGSGLGAIALSALLAEQHLLAVPAPASPADAVKTPIRPVIDPRHPLGARPPHFPPKAKKRPCYLLLWGGV